MLRLLNSPKLFENFERRDSSLGCEVPNVPNATCFVVYYGSSSLGKYPEHEQGFKYPAFAQLLGIPPGYRQILQVAPKNAGQMPPIYGGFLR